MGGPRAQTAREVPRVHGVSQVRRAEYAGRAPGFRSARRDDRGRAGHVLPEAALRRIPVRARAALTDQSRGAEGLAARGLAFRGRLGAHTETVRSGAPA